MRAAVAVLALALASGGCVELGVVTDASSISYGRPNRGRLLDGVRLPDSGPGWVTPRTWKVRGNRYGTNELVRLLKNVAHRMQKRSRGVRLVVADLSGRRGGENRAFHRSHQNGRDVDLFYYVRDAEGKPLEPNVMHVFDASLTTRDGSGITVDVPRTWSLVKELLTAEEAYVQYIFMYRPIAAALLTHAAKRGEPDYLLARAAMAMKQPGDSAPHNDHMHVRVYCAPNDRQFGCVDIGPLELLAEREVEAQNRVEMIASTLTPATTEATDDDYDAVAAIASVDPSVPREKSAADVWAETTSTSAASILPPSSSFSALFRATAHLR